MTYKRLLLVIGIVVIGVAGSAYLLSAAKRSNEIANPASTATTQVNLPARAASAKVSSATAVVSVQDHQLSAAYKEFAASPDYRATLLQLLARSTPESNYLATLVPARCGLLLPKSVAALRANIEKAANSNTEKARMLALEKLQRPCANISAEDIDPIAEKRFEMLKSAAAQGDTRARSEFANITIEGATQLRAEALASLPAALQTKDPIVAENIASFYNGKFGDRPFTLPGIEGSVSGADLSAALRLLACEFGKDCSQNSPELAMACVRQARCDATSVYDYIQRYELTPDRMGRLLNIQKVFQDGISSGSWPSGLWPQMARKP